MPPKKLPPLFLSAEKMHQIQAKAEREMAAELAALEAAAGAKRLQPVARGRVRNQQVIVAATEADKAVDALISGKAYQPIEKPAVIKPTYIAPPLARRETSADTRLFAEIAPVEKVAGGLGRRSGVYARVADDSNTVELCKKSTEVQKKPTAPAAAAPASEASEKKAAGFRSRLFNSVKPAPGAWGVLVTRPSRPNIEVSTGSDPTHLSPSLR